MNSTGGILFEDSFNPSHQATRTRTMEYKRITDASYREDIVELARGTYGGYDWIVGAYDNLWMKDPNTYYVYGIEIPMDDNARTLFSKNHRETFIVALEIIRIQVFNGERVGSMEGLRVHRDYRGRGLAHSIQQFMVQTIAPCLGIAKVLYTTSSMNIASDRVAMASGLQKTSSYLYIMVANEGPLDVPFLAFPGLTVSQFHTRVKNALRSFGSGVDGAPIPSLVVTSTGTPNDIPAAMACIPKNKNFLFQSWKAWEVSTSSLQKMVSDLGSKIVLGHCDSIKRKEYPRTCSIGNVMTNEAGDTVSVSVLQPDGSQAHAVEDLLAHIDYWLSNYPNVRGCYFTIVGEHLAQWETLFTYDVAPRTKHCEILYMMDVKKSQPGSSNVLATSFRIRNLREDDLAQVEELTKGVFGGNDYIVDAFKTMWFKHPDVFHAYCLEANSGTKSRIAATELIRVGEFNDEKVGHMEAMRVHTECRGQGIAHIMQNYMLNTVAKELKLKRVFYLTTTEAPGSMAVAARSGIPLCSRYFYLFLSSDPNGVHELFAFPELSIPKYIDRALSVIRKLADTLVPGAAGKADGSSSMLKLTAEVNDVESALKCIPEDCTIVFQDWKVFDRSAKTLQRLVSENGHQLIIGHCSLIENVQANRSNICSIGYFRSDLDGDILIMTIHVSPAIGEDADPAANTLLAIDILSHIHFWFASKPNMKSCYLAFNDRLRGAHKILDEHKVFGGPVSPGMDARCEVIYSKVL